MIVRKETGEASFDLDSGQPFPLPCGTFGERVESLGDPLARSVGDDLGPASRLLERGGHDHVEWTVLGGCNGGSGCLRLAAVGQQRVGLPCHRRTAFHVDSP